jgi:hypothetical protein
LRFVNIEEKEMRKKQKIASIGGNSSALEQLR